LNTSFPLENILGDDPAGALQSLAETTRFKDTTYWHIGLGWALWEANQIDAATKQFDMAIKKDDSAWKPREMIARCYARQGIYTEAIRQMKEAIAKLPDELKWLKPPPWFMGYVMRWEIESGKTKDAVGSTRAAFEAEPRRLSPIFYHIRALSEAHNYGDLVQFLGRLSQPDPSVEGGSYLIRFLSTGFAYDVFDEIGVAICFSEPRECPGFLRAGLDEALKRVTGEANPWTRCRIAAFNFRYSQKQEGAVQIWEDTIARAGATTYGTKIGFGSGRMLAIDELSQFYYDQAVHADKSDGDPEAWVEKLRNLATLDRENQADAAIRRTSNPSILLGTWLRKHPSQDLDEWKGYFRPKILEGIALLLDLNPENDQQAYATLGTTLLHAGKTNDAAAALAVTLLPMTHPEIKGKDKPATAETDQPQNLPVVRAEGFIYWWRCAGRCNKRKEEYEELYFCEDCIETCFCGDCKALVEKGQLKFRRCSSDHNFFKALPVDENQKEKAAKLDEQTRNVELDKEWIGELRKIWEEVRK
jgi:tetratricopeptide (TPR) repeat protein